MSESRGDHVERTLAGETRLDIGAVFSEAWQRVPGSKLVLFGGFLAFYLVLIPVVTVVGLMLTALGMSLEEGVGGLLLQLLVVALVYPFMAGIFMTSLRWLSGAPIGFAQLLAHYDRTPQLVLMNIASSVGILIGLVLFVLPGIYIGVAWMLAMPLIVDRGLGVFEALELSRKLVTKHWFSVFAFVIISGLILALGAFTFGIAYIWFLPWMCLAFAILYRQLAGSLSFPDDDSEAPTAVMA
ncbi:MAG TPA: hypothetical protein VLA56_09665 [Pseudomonadales bacterium]|nr:hypothetical protein [Pseudomonadales bacterium]